MLVSLLELMIHNCVPAATVTLRCQPVLHTSAQIPWRTPLVTNKDVYTAEQRVSEGLCSDRECDIADTAVENVAWFPNLALCVANGGKQRHGSVPDERSLDITSVPEAALLLYPCPPAQVLGCRPDRGTWKC